MKQNLCIQIVADGKPGGGTTAVLGLIEDILLAGWSDVRVCTQSNSYLEEKSKALKFFGINVELWSLWGYIVSAIKLFSYIRKNKPDAVHFHGNRAAYLMLCPLFWTRSWRAVYTIHGYHFQKKGFIARTFAIILELIVVRFVDVQIFVSDSDLLLGRKLHIHCRNNAVVKNGVDILKITDDYKVSDFEFDVVFLGRIVNQKNPLLLVDIALNLPTDISFAIVGDGDLMIEFQERLNLNGIASRFRFFGSLDRELGLQVLSRSKIFVLPSFWEGLPIAPIEAMAIGLPVVASAIQGTNEIVVDGVTGFLIDGFDPIKYAQAIEAILSNEELHRNLSKASITRAGEFFNRQPNSLKIFNFYRSRECV